VVAVPFDPKRMCGVHIAAPFHLIISLWTKMSNMCLQVDDLLSITRH